MYLNPKQEEAKNHINGPLLIIAGAGSGKTATLATRVEYMIREKGILPSSIMMVTFTNKAASEMRNRVANTLGRETPKNLYSAYNFPLIGTFHSIGIFILKEVLANFASEELNIGIKKDFVIYDEQDKLSVLKNIVKERLSLNEKEFPSKLIATYISNAKNALITAKGYEKEVDSRFKEVVFKVYFEYEKTLIANNAMDFDDILIKTYNVLNIPKILEIYQERYHYIMVDEYQDTNLVQYKFIRLLASKYENLAVVGDDAQSIYSWRGADMRNIIDFKKDYPNALIVKLEQNYRSTKKIIFGANSVIANNNIGIKKELWTENIDGKCIQYIEAPNDRVEADVIVEIIKNSFKPPLTPPYQGGEQDKNSSNYLYKEEINQNPSVSLYQEGINQNLPLDKVELEGIFGHKEQIQISPFDEEKNKISPIDKGGLRGGALYKDNLILYRINAQSRKLEEALVFANIPYRVIGGLKFYDRMEIKDLLAYLKVLYNGEDVVSMKRIINKPTRKIGDKTIEILDKYREDFGLNYLQIIENIDEVKELNSGAKNAVKNFALLYEDLVAKSKKFVVSDLIREIIKDTNYIEYLTDGLTEEEKKSKTENVDEFINVASEYNGMEPRESLALFLEEISLITDMDLKDERNDYVTLMTIHSSKGLEQKRVFITGVEEGLFPSIRSIGEQASLEEERRLMYVAMTRAKEELYISRAIERFHFGDYVRNMESRFIKEISKDCIENYDEGEFAKTSNNFFSSLSPLIARTSERQGNIIKKNIQNNDISEFSIGNKVVHPKFGNGIITDLNGEIASIAFPGSGVKKMNIRIAPVRKM